MVGKFESCCVIKMCKFQCYIAHQRSLRIDVWEKAECTMSLPDFSKNIWVLSKTRRKHGKIKLILLDGRIIHTFLFL